MALNDVPGRVVMPASVGAVVCASFHHRHAASAWPGVTMADPTRLGGCSGLLASPGRRVAGLASPPTIDPPGRRGPQRSDAT